MQYDNLPEEILNHPCFRCEYGSYTGMGFVYMLAVCVNDKMQPESLRTEDGK